MPTQHSKLLELGADLLRHIAWFVCGDVVDNHEQRRLRGLCRAMDASLCEQRTWAHIHGWEQLATETRAAADWTIDLNEVAPAGLVFRRPTPPPMLRQLRLFVNKPDKFSSSRRISEAERSGCIAAGVAALRAWLLALPCGQLQTLHLAIQPMSADLLWDDEPWFVDFVVPVIERFAAGCVDLYLSSGLTIPLARHPIPRRLLMTAYGIMHIVEPCEPWLRTLAAFGDNPPPRCRELSWVSGVPCPPSIVAAAQQGALEQLEIWIVSDKLHAAGVDRWWLDGPPIPRCELEICGWPSSKDADNFEALAQMLCAPTMAAVPIWDLELWLSSKRDMAIFDRILCARRGGVAGRVASATYLDIAAATLNPNRGATGPRQV